MQRILTFHQQKNNSVFVIFLFEILTNRFSKLTMSLILSYWALIRTSNDTLNFLIERERAMEIILCHTFSYIYIIKKLSFAGAFYAWPCNQNLHVHVQSDDAF